jgi:AcrR family transcriptional regulator
MRMSASTRLTAEERRDEIVAAASVEFAATGFAGTSTDAIARRAGVSQPYLFQLFRTKKDLFIAAVRDCFDRTRRAFETSGRKAKAAGLGPDRVLDEMGHAYVRLLLADRAILRLQLQAYAACEDADIQAVVRTNYALLWQTVANMSGADPKAVHAWFAEGMLINVVASITSPDALDPAKAVTGKSTYEDFLRSLIGGESVEC